MSNIDAARQRQKEDELAKLKRKREKARMQRDYNRIYKECAARQKRIVRNVTFRHSRLDLPLEEWEEEHGLGDLDYGWARHRKQRMQPVTDERQLLNYQSGYNFPKLRLGGGVSNDYQTLKDGTMLARASSKIKLTRATLVSSLKKFIVAEVSSSMLHTLVRTNSGAVMSFGVGRSGQLGHNNTLDIDGPKKIACFNRTRVLKVGAYGSHSLVIGRDLRTNEMIFYSFGENSSLQLGLGDDKTLSQYNSPQKINCNFLCHDGTVHTINHIKTIGGGSKHSIALLTNGKIFSWGSNGVGQLGHGKFFENLNAPKQILKLKHQNVLVAACGDLHTCAVTDAGDVWTWGRALEGQLGHGKMDVRCLYKPQFINVPELADIRFELVACGRYHTVISSTDGVVYSFGSNKGGQLSTNDPTLTKRLAPVPVIWDKTVKLDNVHVKELSVGAHHTLIRDALGTVYSCGWSGFNGRLGHTTSERVENLKEVTVYREDALNEDGCWRREFLDRMLDTDIMKMPVEPDWIFAKDAKHVLPGNKISADKMEELQSNFERTQTGNFLNEMQRVFRALNLGTSGELLEIEVRRILFRMHISTWGLGYRKILDTTPDGFGYVDEWDFINFLVQKFEAKQIRKRYFPPPYRAFKWIIDEYDDLKPKAAVMSMHVKTFIRIFTNNCANLNAEVDRELIRKMFEYEVNQKAEVARLQAIGIVINTGKKDMKRNMHGIERLDSIANHPLRPPSRELHELLENDGVHASPQTKQRLENVFDDDPEQQYRRPSTPVEQIAKGIDKMETAVAKKIKFRKPLQPKLRKGIVNWSNLGLNDKHIHALSLSLQELPILSEINLNENVISDEGINKLLDVIEWQYLLSEYDMHTTQCMQCHNDVYFESRTRHTAFCTICNRSSWRPVYFLSKVTAKEQKILGIYEQFKWTQSFFDQDASTRVAKFLNARDNPVSIADFRRFFESILDEHIETFREHGENVCQSIRKPTLMTSTYNKKIKKIKDGVEVLINDLREYAESTFHDKHLPRYRIISLSELQKASNEIREWLIDATFKYFHDNLPMTDEALLFKIQELHVEAVKRIRDQPWEFKRMINVTVKVLYAIAKDLYEHYMTLKKKTNVKSISCGYSDSLTISNSGLVYSFGNSSGIIEAFKEQIIYNLPDRFRHSIENDRAKNKSDPDEDVQKKLGGGIELFGARQWHSYDETQSESSLSSYSSSPRSDSGSLSSRSSYSSYSSSGSGSSRSSYSSSSHSSRSRTKDDEVESIESRIISEKYTSSEYIMKKDDNATDEEVAIVKTGDNEDIETPRKSPHKQKINIKTPKTIVVKPKRKKKKKGKEDISISAIDAFTKGVKKKKKKRLTASLGQAKNKWNFLQNKVVNAQLFVQNMRSDLQSWKDEVNDSIENSTGGASVLRTQQKIAEKKLADKYKMEEDLVKLNYEVVRLRAKDAAMQEEKVRQQQRMEARLRREREAKARIAGLDFTELKKGDMMALDDEVPYDPYYVDEEEARYGTEDDLLNQFNELDKAMILGLWEGMEHDYKRVKVGLLHILEAKKQIDKNRKRIL